MSSYSLLDQTDEDTLHKSRLLNVEEKPFKRITKRLLSSTSLITTPVTLPPTPPPDATAADEAAAAHEKDKQALLDFRRQWREDCLLDFAAFESSIIRIQFLLTSNIKERERYATEKLKIQATAQAVRENTSDLRVQLEEAQKRLALRKEYDELAEKITSNRLLRPREDQHANLRKLNAEIADLERESAEYAHTWAERRQQFGRIIEEGMQLRRLIRDEKEEVERREGMMEGEEGEGEEEGREKRSRVGTPGGETPMLGVEKGEGSGEVVVGKGPGIEKSPLGEDEEEEEEKEGEEEEEEDEDMAEDGELGNDQEEGESAVAAAPVEGLIADDEQEEGAPDEEGRDAPPPPNTDTHGEQMDIT